VLKEIEIRSISGVRYLLRIVPYRTTDNVIDGLVLTFVDVDRLLQTIVELENPANVAE
jgi:two-component system CheB/CheR fusion protein